MARPFFVLVCLSLILGACTQRVICPAYQSAFIYDKEALRKKFSYFQEDSTPKVFTASKNRYLVAEPTSYRKKLRSLQTVVMKDVNPVLPDSILIAEGEMEAIEGEDGVVPGAELDLAARSVIDSTFIVDVPRDTAEAEVDSIYQISKDKEVRMLKYDFPDSLIYDEATGRYVAETPKYVITNIRFNVEQDNYMWYLRHNLVLPDVKLAHQQQEAAKEEASGKSKKKEKKGIKGFFKNLFKKKNKDESDSTDATPVKPEGEEFDYVDTTAVEQPQGTSATTPVKKEKKGGLFKKKKDAETVEGFESATIPSSQDKPKKKKKEKKAKKKKEEEVLPEEKKDDEDDGF